MPLATFKHLSPEKQARIRAALLTEFSQHSLDDAQVARIIKQAHIARGAFYKYFSDLNDAYCYLYQLAMKDIHQTVTDQGRLLSAGEYLAQVKHFIESVNEGPYRDLVRLHYQTNEGLIKGQAGPVPRNAEEWAIMTLVHQTIKECLLYSAGQTHSLQYLATVLDKLLPKEE